MKKNFFSLAAIAAVAVSSVALYSCDPNENDGGTDQVLLVPVPETSAEASQLVNAVYGPLQTLSSSYSFFLESATETTVCFEEKDETKDGPQVSILETEPSNWYAIKIFNRLYSSISAANTAIDRIGKADSEKVSTTALSKETLIARAQFIRGYDYFKLVQYYGEVPLILNYPASDSEKTTRKSVEDVYVQAAADLEASIAKLPEYSADKSVPSQLAAKTILAKLYLTWGQKPLTQSDVEAIVNSTTDPAKPAVDNAKLAKAISYANEVISSNKYRILPNFNNIWGVGNENNDEVIFSIHHDGDGLDAQGNHQTHCGYTWPKDERADPHIQWADILYEKGANEGGYGLPASDERQLYSYATKVAFQDGNVDTLTWPLSIVRPGKWVHRDGSGTINAVPNQPNNIDHIDYRLAEVYLIKAEAQWYANNGDKGLAAVNEVRKRAGVDELGTINEAAIQQEWLNELAFEQKHWLNLVRWRTLISSIKNKVPAYEYYKDVYSNQAQFNAYSYNGISADPTRFAFYKRINLHLHKKVANIKGKFYRFPIPLSEKYTPLGIDGQNPGY
ncbi:MAG: RagB/SusD family nutrient uptake outer membrane protein [Prevotellaceae bacterium]|jgi:hypothetical protein|nr:RagB/SusD family nutrient uptake outer membrane protein [Prevotellaceae bacterium]